MTTLPAEAPVDGAGEVEGGVEGYLAEKDRLIREAKSKVPPVETATPAVEVPPVETPPASAATPAVPAVPAEVPPVEVPPVEVPPGESADDKKPDRIRIGTLSDAHLVKAATDIAREEKIPFAEAFERVKPKAPGVAPAPATPAPETNGLRTRAEVEADIATAREERRAAAVAVDNLERGASGKMIDAAEKLELLEGELKEVSNAEHRAALQKQNAEETAFTRLVNESKGKACEYWPDAGVDDSDFSKRMLELSDKYEADPRLAHHVYEADAPFFFAELVAKERGELPAHLKAAAPAAPAATPEVTPSTPPPTKPAPVNQRAVLRQTQPAAGPASGAARTTQEIPKDELGVDSIRTVADYERVKKKVLITKR